MKVIRCMTVTNLCGGVFVAIWTLRGEEVDRLAFTLSVDDLNCRDRVIKRYGTEKRERLKAKGWKDKELRRDFKVIRNFVKDAK